MRTALSRNPFIFILFFILYQNCITQEYYHLKYDVLKNDKGDGVENAFLFDEIFFIDYQMVGINAKSRILIDTANTQVIITDELSKTCLQTALPFNPLNIMTEVAALRFLEERPDDKKIKVTIKAFETGNVKNQRITIDFEEGVYDRVVLMTQELPAVKFEIGNLFCHLLSLQLSEWSPGLYHKLSGLKGVILECLFYSSGDTVLPVIHAKSKKVEKKTYQPELFTITKNFQQKKKVTYSEFKNHSIGKIKPEYCIDEKDVLDVIEKFRDGYRKKDVSHISEWVDEIMTEDVCVLGTDGAWPETWEWRSGKTSAAEMFARDWQRWGNLKIFDDEIFVNVEGNAAWIVAFATVEGIRTDSDLSRKRSLARIKEYAAEDWASQRALYEIIADASSVLVQYERSHHYVTPLRAEFGLVKRENKWFLKMIHFSHPARGFRSFRLFHADPELLKNKSEEASE